MKAVIPESFISIYDITVPYVLDMRKLRKRLDAELEKLHPRFPDRCVADYRLRFQPAGDGTAGIHIRAVVMDRFQLAAIKKKNEGCVLYAGGSHPYPVFSGDILKKWLLIAAAGLAVLAVFFIFLAVVRMKPAADAVPEQEADVFPVEYAADSSKDVVLPEPEELLEAEVPDYSPFLSGLYDLHGSVSFLSWNADDGTLRVQVRGLYPEQLSELFLAGAQSDASFRSMSFGQVSYQEGVPDVQVTLSPVSAQGSQPGVGTEAVAASVREGAVSSVRSLVLKDEGQLLSETVSPPSLSAGVSESAWVSFAPALSKLLEVTPVRLLELSRSDGSITMHLELSDSNGSLPFSDLACIFSDAPGLPHESEPEDEWTAALAEQREIGRISRGDGTSVLFFHGADGKIERRIYED